jgi:hypothetical protein
VPHPILSRNTRESGLARLARSPAPIGVAGAIPPAGRGRGGPCGPWRRRCGAQPAAPNQPPSPRCHPYPTGCGERAPNTTARNDD